MAREEGVAGSFAGMRYGATSLSPGSNERYVVLIIPENRSIRKDQSA